MPVAHGSRTDWGDIYSGFREWHAKLGDEAWPATKFGDGRSLRSPHFVATTRQSSVTPLDVPHAAPQREMVALT
jgi:hypothetical protein